MFLHIACWIVGLLPSGASWELSRYEALNFMPPGAIHAHEVTRGGGGPREDILGFKRTLWYATRETTSRAWDERSGAHPATPEG